MPVLSIDEAMRQALERHGAGDWAQAASAYRSVLATAPDHFDALRWLALVEIRQGRVNDAEALLKHAVRVQPQSADVWANLAVVQKTLGRLDDALASCQQALSIAPRHVEALYNRGILLTALGRYEQALQSYAGALATKPHFAEALNNVGGVLAQMKRYEHAVASYDRALAVAPLFAEALYNRGLALSYVGRNAEASRDFKRVLELNPELAYAEGMSLHADMHCAQWDEFDVRSRKIVERVRAGERCIDPLALLAITDSSSDQRACAETWVRDKCPAVEPPLWQGERYRHERIRVAYLSADFRDHPTAHLTADLFARHDRERFETIALSFGSTSDDDMRSRLSRSFDRFVDVPTASNHEIAALMRSMEVDIAVDLMGFTADARTAVLALRPAPIQVNYLGFPGTMGASYIDYVLADAYVIPPKVAQHYSERIIYLPDVFQAVNATRPRGGSRCSRRDAALPENVFVFCCFNTLYKVTPLAFDAWMRILKGVDDSVLWLTADNAVAQANLRNEAEKRGVDAARISFAPRVSYAEHLARLPLGDLFLDTVPFNAGATASDALWAGLPVLTVSGEAFAARMAGSLLHAAGMPEFITESLDQYEAMALRLAGDRDTLGVLRQKLVRHRESAPLFDAERFRRNIEAAYVTMWEGYQRG